MRDRAGANTDTWAWLVVVVAGLVVVAVVIGLELFGRLDAGQRVLDGAAPAFTEERVAGDRVGVDMVSTIVDLADPIVTAEGGAAAEVAPLIGFVADATGLSEDQVLAALGENFPHTTNLLLAIPLEDVTAELPGLVAFVADATGLTDDEVLAAISDNFPRLAQSIVKLPPVTDGWNQVPGTENLTDFSGQPVRSVPEIRDYLSGDVVAAVEAVADDERELDGTQPPVDVFPPLLVILGVLVIAYGAAMLVITRVTAPTYESPEPTPTPETPPWDEPEAVAAAVGGGPAST